MHILPLTDIEADRAHTVTMECDSLSCYTVILTMFSYEALCTTRSIDSPLNSSLAIFIGALPSQKLMLDPSIYMQVYTVAKKKIDTHASNIYPTNMCSKKKAFLSHHGPSLA